MSSVILISEPTPEHQRKAFMASTAVGGCAQPINTCSGPTALPCCADLMQAFRATGGVISGDSLAILLRKHSDQPLSLLGRWIVHGQVLSFECHSQTLLPVFQFDLACLTVQLGLRSVMTELRGVFNDRELVNWFATPNCWLFGASPVDVFAKDLAAVVHAARTDRFVATG